MDAGLEGLLEKGFRQFIKNTRGQLYGSREAAAAAAAAAAVAGSTAPSTSAPHVLTTGATAANTAAPASSGNPPSSGSSATSQAPVKPTATGQDHTAASLKNIAAPATMAAADGDGSPPGLSPATAATEPLPQPHEATELMFMYAKNGDVNRLEELLTEDVEIYLDSQREGGYLMLLFSYRLALYTCHAYSTPCSGGDTPLIVAAREGFENIVELLIDEGASVNIENDHGRTALHEAAVSGR